MLYANYQLTTSDPKTLEEVIKHCPYGILHCRNQQTGSKLAVLVRVFYSETSGIRFRIAHSYKVLIGELCREQVSLKLCNRDKNIYVVADVSVSQETRTGFLSKSYLKGAVTRLNIFRKNKAHQLIALDRAS